MQPEFVLDQGNQETEHDQEICKKKSQKAIFKLQNHKISHQKAKILF